MASFGSEVTTGNETYRFLMRDSGQSCVSSRSAPAGANPPPIIIGNARTRMDYRNARHAGGVDYTVGGEP